MRNIRKPDFPKLMAFDLDGTLLRSDGTVSAYTCEILTQAAALGIHVVIASGRPLCALPCQVTALPCIKYAITSNGSSIFQLTGQRRIAGTDMDPGLVLSLAEIFKALPWPCECFTEGRAYTSQAYYDDPAAFGVTVATGNYMRATRRPVADMSAFILAHKDRIEGLDLVVTDPSARQALAERFRQIPDLYMTSSTRFYLEFASGDVSKAGALARLLYMLDLNASDMAAFGDALNDLEMLRFAQTGIAVSGGDPRLIAAADDICPGNDEDGPARYIAQNYL